MQPHLLKHINKNTASQNFQQISKIFYEHGISIAKDTIRL
jgi:hypothetical protein